MTAVNLLPDSHRRGRRQGAQSGGAYVVVGVLSALLLMVVAYTLSSNQVNSRKAQAAEAKQKADSTQARAQSLGAFGDFAQVKATRTASVKQLASGRFDWERFLRELAAVLPRGTWLQETEASVTGDVGSETAGSSTPAAGTTGAPVKPAASLTGCAPHQRDVASLMVRLRKVYLVDTVELGQSSQGEGGGAPSIESCGRYLQFDLKLTFEAASPVGKEAPPGHHTVPARLGGGS
jgi:Tfp pilus assembly protein PilN